MPVKVVFIGNCIGGDDGIGPFLYKELADEPRLKDQDLMELGVIGLDLLSYVQEGDKLIIVDALKMGGTVGEVARLREEDLKPEIKLVSQHDFGVEETAAVMRVHRPGIKSIDVVGVRVDEVKEYKVGLSNTLIKKMPEIKEKVINLILEISKE